jgi:putative glutamine amidotransferase
MIEPNKVGVTTSVRGSTMLWLFYWLALKLAGLKPVRIRPNNRSHDLTTFAGFLIGGGDNIGAGIYNGDLTLDIEIDLARDALELDILKVADERGVPVLGVCRGAQLLNAHRGGNLHQDIRKAYQGVPHMWTPLPRKGVTVEPGTLLHRIMKLTAFRANSLHRQSIDRLGQDLCVSAVDRYGIVQAVECCRGPRFMLGVQWHPEFMIYRSAQRAIFLAFRDAVCKNVPEC